MFISICYHFVHHQEAPPEQESFTRMPKSSHESVDGGIAPVEGGRVTAADSNMRSGDGGYMSDRQLNDMSL